MSTDEGVFGGFDRIPLKMKYKAEFVKDMGDGFKMYLPARTAVCLVKK